MALNPEAGRMKVLTRLVVAAAISTLCGTNAAAERRGAFLSDLTWPEAEKRLREASMVIVPFGAGAKEHGPHLPLGTDQIVMEYLAAIAVESFSVNVAPPILHAWFPAFRDFPGTAIEDPDVFCRYVLEVGRSLVRRGAKRVLFLNTGITCSTGIPISIAARELHSQERVPTLVISWDDLETPETAALAQQLTGTHADEIETSILLVLRCMPPDTTCCMEDGTRRVPGRGGAAFRSVFSL